MAGHSKWANIKHRKAAVDKKRGKLWSKCSRALMAAARQGGGDPASNLALRYAIDAARYANMPKDTIQRAIDKGAGGAAGDNFEPVTYEGFGPGGAAIIVDALTDNRKRTVDDVRLIFTKHAGNLGNSGSVAFMFQSKGQIRVPAKGVSEDQLMEAAIGAGATDVEAPDDPADEDAAWLVYTAVPDVQTVRDALDAAGLRAAEATLTKVPANTVEVRGQPARDLVALLEALEDNDDVQKVYTNADLSDEDLADA